jgi:hypothetical protein
MRRLSSSSLWVTVGATFLGAAACAGPTAPDGPRITIWVLDGGRAVSRTRVIVTSTEGAAAPERTALTGDDGVATVDVPAAGLYTVRVLPRGGYRGGQDPLTKTVTLAGAGAVTVSFTVLAEGASDWPRPTDNPAGGS